MQNKKLYEHILSGTQKQNSIFEYVLRYVFDDQFEIFYSTFANYNIAAYLVMPRNNSNIGLLFLTKPFEFLADDDHQYLSVILKVTDKKNTKDNCDIMMLFDFENSKFESQNFEETVKQFINQIIMLMSQSVE